MRGTGVARWLLLPLGMLVHAAAQEAPRADTSPGEKAAAGRPWIQGLEEGRRQALTSRKPVLVRAVAEWCPACRAMETVFAAAEVQAELDAWTLVEVDVDRAPDQAQSLNVAVVPAFRIQTAAGQLVASRDGGMPAPELTAWLKEHRAAAEAAPDNVLLEQGQPDLVAAVRLSRYFADRDPAVRQAAIGRLAPYPSIANGVVLKAFREGNLATRLAAMEVLDQWKAPLGELDPWRPETIAGERLARLERWLDQLGQRAPPDPSGAPPASAAAEALTPDQLADTNQEIERMLRASDAEAEAARDRLAQFGPALFPEIQRRLSGAESDRERERLRALRYRLVAADSLALRWPGGLSRMAATEAAVRQRAAEELARQATPEDQPLLLEMFSDPDPLVREISLRGLQEIGGSLSTAALARLLSDPEPNVRAAVLKQLEENPQRTMVAPVAEYVAREKNPDLLVHAARFLQAAGGSVAQATLISLLRHESWQVRADAAAGLAKIGSTPYRVARAEVPESRIEVYVALLDLLTDPDAFVVSRAVEGLADADLEVAVEPLAAAAVKHPDLAPQIIAILVRGRAMRRQALPHLRQLARHADPHIRAAAVAGLADAAPSRMDEELQAALSDGDGRVRIVGAQCVSYLAVRSACEELSAAARALGDSEISLSMADVTPLSLAQQVIATMEGWEATTADRLLPAEPGTPKAGTGKDGQAGTPPGRQSDPHWERWLRRLYSGRSRPESLTRSIGLVTRMMAEGPPAERVPAAMALVVLGQHEPALRGVMEAAEADPQLFAQAAQVLPWLTWDARLSTLGRLRALANTEGKLSELVAALVVAADARAADTFWGLLADPKATGEMVVSIGEELRKMFFPTSGREDQELPQPQRRAVAAAVKPRVLQGADWQRLVGLLLVLRADPDEALELARGMAEDTSLSARLRNAAFHVILAGGTPEERLQVATAALGSADRFRKRLAMEYFVRGTAALRELTLESAGASFPVPVPDAEAPSGFGLDATPITLEPPPGLQPGVIRPLMKDADMATAAYAGYLMALFGEPEGFPLVMRYWRENRQPGADPEKLVYRSIAALNDPGKISLLREIYGRLSEYDVRDFYWTIRVMTGPEILRFRDQIRDEVGMENLR